IDTMRYTSHTAPNHDGRSVLTRYRLLSSMEAAALTLAASRFPHEDSSIDQIAIKYRTTKNDDHQGSKRQPVASCKVWLGRRYSDKTSHHLSDGGLTSPLVSYGTLA